MPELHADLVMTSEDRPWFRFILLLWDEPEPFTFSRSPDAEGAEAMNPILVGSVYPLND